MCGIVGIWHLNGRPLDVGRLVTATGMLRHRGPDDEGYLLVDSRSGRYQACRGSDTKEQNGLPHIEDVEVAEFDLAFGHRRLAILDLSAAGHQPLVDRSTGDALVFNGEIYNHPELANELTGSGEVLASRCDTEVLFKTLQRLGVERALSALDGMFSFGYWDANARVLSCARDRFGEKPFVYCHRPAGVFVFASEMKALFPFVGVPDVDARALADFLAYGAVPWGEQTFFETFRRVPPGHRISVDRHGLQVARYWEVDINHRDRRPGPELVSEFRDRLDLSVRRRARSDVPLGSSLSGGLDSSSVVCLLSRSAGLGRSTFTARFPGSLDEGGWAQMVTERTGTMGHEVWPSQVGFLEELDDLIWHQEEPFPTASIYAQWKVMELAKQHDITVLLDGQGADETLAGYPSYLGAYHADLLRRGMWRRLRTQRQRLRGQLGRHAPPLSRVAAEAFIPSAIKTRIAGRLAGARALWGPSGVLPSELAPTARQRAGRAGVSVGLSASLRSSFDRGDGLQSLLRYADLNSMAQSREVRLPFLDHALVEFVFSLPDGLKLDGGLGKVVLRESMQGIIPEEIRQRTDKIGYEPPQRDWLATESMAEWVRSGMESLISDGWLRSDVRGSLKDPAAMWRPSFRWGVAGQWLRAVQGWRVQASAVASPGTPLIVNET